MNYLFIFNPHSIPGEDVEKAVQAVRNIFDAQSGNSDEYATHISRFPRDAMWVIREFAKGLSEGEKFRVCCVGGAGQLFDCLGGIMNLCDTKPDL